MLQEIRENVDFIKSITNIEPYVAIILGTGLSDAIKSLENQVVIPYVQIPNFPSPKITGHSKELLLGEMEGVKVAVMRGRAHYYEGYTPADIGIPIRTLKRLGAKILVVTNAAGGINQSYKRGDLVLIYDHINLMGINPLIGSMDEKLGNPFPDMTFPYSQRLLKLAEKTFASIKITPKYGIYAGVAGPSLETPAELRFLEKIGADLVGMSTIPEVIVAKQEQMETLGISVVSNMVNLSQNPTKEVSHETIIKTAELAAKKLKLFFTEFLKKLRA